jgi:tetratricopeptide (TPR) repeat protein
MVALLGHAYAAAGRSEEARTILDQLQNESKTRYVPSYPIAAIYAALGEKQEALKYLDRAREERDSWMPYIALDPRLDNLRSEPRFRELLGRMRLGP